MSPSPSPAPRAFTLVEAAVSTVVVGLMLAAALNTAAAARVRERHTSERQKAAFLAETLMAEILDKPYVDGGLLPLFGPEADELLTSRATFDDVDDYHGLSESPPKSVNGTALTGYSGFTQAVTVQWVSSDLATASASETGIKRITVTVSIGKKRLFELAAVRSRARDNQ